MKSEPDTYAYSHLERDGVGVWDGVRNHTAAANLRAMEKGDEVFFYHSNEGKEIVGIAKVTRTAFPDVTDPTGRFVAIEVAPVRLLKAPVTLKTMKATPALADMAILRQGRLSVAPITPGEWKTILALSEAQGPSMRLLHTALVGALACAGIWLTAQSAATPDLSPPLWAYPLNPPPPAGAPRTPPDPGPYTVPGSTLTFTRAQQNLFNPPDWHPEDHPPMPDVVARGRRPDVYACAYCHLPSGQGRSENATLSGLPEAYFIQQMADFKSGARKSTVPHRATGDNMALIARAISDEESAIAAAYFAKIKPKSYLKVIETSTPPRTVDRSWILTRHPEGGREPIDNRVIEIPADFERFERRDGRIQWLIYVPPGSVAKGRALALGRNGRPEAACVACHGQDLQGMGDIPGLAGRSPSYMARQLTDFRTGARAGPGAPPMKMIADELSATDVVNVTAYLASLK